MVDPNGLISIAQFREITRVLQPDLYVFVFIQRRVKQILCMKRCLFHIFYHLYFSNSSSRLAYRRDSSLKNIKKIKPFLH